MKIRDIFEFNGIVPPSDATELDNTINTEFSDDPQLVQFGREAAHIANDNAEVYFVIDGTVITHGKWGTVKEFIVLNWFDLTSGTYQVIQNDGSVLSTLTLSRRA